MLDAERFGEKDLKDCKVIIATDVTRISVMYAMKMGISEDEAMRIFLGSATYKALINYETGLCYEMNEAIYEMFLEEVEMQ